jgi:hypothetical protein
MLVYRIEDAFGCGYKGRRYDRDYPSLDSLSQCHESYITTSWFCNKSRPIPWQDNIPKNFIKREGWYFGFHTEHQITRFFSPYDLFLMGYFGGNVITFDINEKHVWKGDNQCVFFKKHGTIIETKNCAEYSYIKDFGKWADMEEVEESLKELSNFKTKMEHTL